jgi:Rieske Fe-S protein
MWRVSSSCLCPWQPRLMRARLLLVLVLVSVGVLAGVAAFVALRGSSGTRAGIVAVDVSDLHPGQVMPVEASLPGQPRWSRRVFVVHLRGDGVKAFLGRSTHLGCRLWFRGDPHFGDGLSRETGIAFQDPCGGSVFALNGDCVGGPCPRGLDRYRLDVQDNAAAIDVNHLLKGPPR